MIIFPILISYRAVPVYNITNVFQVSHISWESAKLYTSCLFIIYQGKQENKKRKSKAKQEQISLFNKQLIKD